MRSSLPLALALVALAPLIAAAHRHTDAWARPRDPETEIRYMPSGRSLAAACLGYEPIVADLLWARATLLFGEKHSSGSYGWYTWLYHMTDLATDLDPRFRAAYKYGGTMLRVEGVFVDQSSMIFQKGMRALPAEWYFPFGIAMNFYEHRADRLLAARYMEKAAAIEGGPFWLRNLAASLYSEASRLETALIFLEESYRNLPDGPGKTAVEVKILETRYLIAKRDAEAAVQEFRQRRGSLPASPQDVAEEGLTLPADPLGGRWRWDDDPGAPWGAVVSTVYHERFLELSKATGLGRLGGSAGVAAGAMPPPGR